MKKMKTVWAIAREKPRVATDLVQEPWVLAGEGVATIKYDGTSCLVEGGRLFRRYDAKKGRAPDGWVPCEPAADPVTGHWPGWLPVDAADPACKWHIEALSAGPLDDGTYELVGPKVQSNRYKLDRHELWKHGREIVEVERTREALVAWLSTHDHEGLVFHHPDGSMAKLRRKDFGLTW